MFKTHLRRMLLFMGVIGLAGWLYALNLPKIYESTIDLQIGAPPAITDPNLPSETARSLQSSFTNDLDTDVGYLKSQRIFGEGLQRAETEIGRGGLATTQNLNALFPMYEVVVPPAQNPYGATLQRIVQVKVRASSPQEAAGIANGVGAAFTEFRRQRIRLAIEDTSRSLRRQVQSKEGEAARLAKAYQQAKEGSAVPDVVAQNTTLTNSKELLRNKRDETVAQLAAVRSTVAQYRATLARTPKTVESGTTSVPDTTVERQKQQVAVDREEYNSLRTVFLDDAIQVQQAKGKLDRSIARLREVETSQKEIAASSSVQQNPTYLQVLGDLQRAEAQEAGYAASLRAYDAQVSAKTQESRKAPALEVTIQRLTRDREIAEGQLSRLRTALSNYESDTTTRVVPLITTADPNTAAQVAPEVRRWAILSLFAGALLGLAYSFAVESLRLPVHTSWQLAELTALPVAAAVPAIPKPLARRHEAAIREGSFRPIESFRYMAFSMLAREVKPKTVMFTGVGGDVGAAAAAAEFAVAVARTGAKTILVDCDLRQPQLSALFGMTGRTGTSDILGRTVLPGDSTDLLAATEHENLSVLPAGSSTEEGLADFQTAYIKGLLDDLAARADIVVLLSPAVDVYSDSARLAQYVEEVCLVVSAKTTSYRSIPMAQEILEKAGARSVSIVLTNASSSDEAFGTRVSDSLVRS